MSERNPEELELGKDVEAFLNNRYWIEWQSRFGGWWAKTDEPSYEQEEAAIERARQVLKQSSPHKAVRVVKRTKRTVWSEKRTSTPEDEGG